MVSILLLIFSSSTFLSKPMETVSRAPFIVDITVNLKFHILFSSLARSIYLSIYLSQMVSIFSLIFPSSTFLSNPLEIVSTGPFTVDITVSLKLHSFFQFVGKIHLSIYLSIYHCSLFCFLVFVVLLICMLSAFFLVAAISLSLVFLMSSSSPRIGANHAIFNACKKIFLFLFLTNIVYVISRM